MPMVVFMLGAIMLTAFVGLGVFANTDEPLELEIEPATSEPPPIIEQEPPDTPIIETAAESEPEIDPAATPVISFISPEMPEPPPLPGTSIEADTISCPSQPDGRCADTYANPDDEEKYRQQGVDFSLWAAECEVAQLKLADSLGIDHSITGRQLADFKEYAKLTGNDTAYSQIVSRQNDFKKIMAYCGKSTKRNSDHRFTNKTGHHEYQFLDWPIENNSEYRQFYDELISRY